MTRTDFASVGELLDAAAAKDPNKVALSLPDESITYGALHELSARIGRGLASLGVQPSDQVGVLGLNSIDFIAAMFGIIRVGAIPVPINNRFKEIELSYIAEHAELVAIITSDRATDPFSFADMLNRATPGSSPRHRIQLGDVEAPGFISRSEFLQIADGYQPPMASPEDRRAGDTAVLMYTSGTTGYPRGCLLSHRCLISAAKNLVDRLELTESDVVWDVMPFFHLGGVLPTMSIVVTGGTMLTMRHFEPRAALDQLEKMRVTVGLPAFETIWMEVLTQPDFSTRDLSRIRVLQNIGVSSRLLYMQEQLPAAVQVSNYGMTELGGYATMHRLDDPLEVRISTSGPGLGDMQFKVLDEAGRDLPAGSRGEIAVRGGQLFSGYFKDPAATAESIDGDGWFRTGDLGTVDELGHVTYVGRRKDMLKVGGENVAAAEIENYLVTHPAVQIAAVVAAADSRYSEVPAAFVQLRAGAVITEEELVDFCVGMIATYKVPRYVRFVTQWPMSGTKIQKFRLRTSINEELRLQGITAAPVIDSTRRSSGSSHDFK